MIKVKPNCPAQSAEEYYDELEQQYEGCGKYYEEMEQAYDMAGAYDFPTEEDFNNAFGIVAEPVEIEE